MLFVECKGSPYEIGHQHGTAAKTEIGRCISFYADLFKKNCKQDWPEVLQHAEAFEKTAKEKWPAYHEEMQGIADGSGHQLLDIVAINVRTEINFGMFSDGCTALSWHTEKRAYLAQNWDWMPAQKQNLILLKISQPLKPTLLQITEAGIIGKIGFNSSGVGTLLNAIKVHGADPARMPVHFGLRAALESTSARDAVSTLKSYGMASSAHILVADATEAVGLEFTKSTFAECEADGRGRIAHANHLLLPHPGETDTVWLKDSPVRVETMLENTEKLGSEPVWEEVSRLFEDERGHPYSICRQAPEEEGGSSTLFNVVMDLKAKRGVVRLGRPVRAEETVTLQL